MQNSILFITMVLLAAHIRCSVGGPLPNNVQHPKTKPADEEFLPDENFSPVTDKKLTQLKDLAEATHDPKLHDLYDAVQHYVHMAHKNNEYVLWKYDESQEGLVLVLKQNLTGILYYG